MDNNMLKARIKMQKELILALPKIYSVQGLKEIAETAEQCELTEVNIDWYREIKSADIKKYLNVPFGDDWYMDDLIGLNEDVCDDIIELDCGDYVVCVVH